MLVVIFVRSDHDLYHDLHVLWLDIKLVIAMHDRYSLGCWGTDAYVAKYNLPKTNCLDGVPDSTIFYTNANAIKDVSL